MAKHQTSDLPLPNSVRSLLSRVPPARRHPGLVLDKLLEPAADQEQQKRQLDLLCQCGGDRPDRNLFSQLRRRRDRMLAALGAQVRMAATDAPLTVCLARSAVFENAGISLHPLYGFPYIPATALKGAARAYAETVWLPSQFQTDGDGPASEADLERARKAWAAIQLAFGWSAETERAKYWRPAGLGCEGSDAAAGALVFHDAWPAGWPRLSVDIVNCHHRRYYQSAESELEKWPPGDWEEPVPVYFLTVKPRLRFQFAISLRRLTIEPGLLEQAGLSSESELLDLAWQWLTAALSHDGVGAKNAAGYGTFGFDAKEQSGQRDIAEGKAEDEQSAGDADMQAAEDTATVQQNAADEGKSGPEAPRSVGTTETGTEQADVVSLPGSRLAAQFELELITPAFLAGADQERASDCELRAATMRGLLRWWWRTLHAGYLDLRTLRRLEAAIWGDTHQSGAVKLRVQPLEVTPVRYARNKVVILEREQKDSPYGIPGEQPDKVTQGIWYLAYGMDEPVSGPARGKRPQQGKQSRRRKQRFYVQPGARWLIQITAKPTRFVANADELSDNPAAYRQAPSISAEAVLAQAQAALWLLSNFGGIGARSRKGFGSLNVARGLAGWDLALCRQMASDLRQSLALPDSFDESRVVSPALDYMLTSGTVRFGWQNVWAVIDQIGFAYQTYTKRYKHQTRKLALGLPRRLGPPALGKYFHPRGPLRLIWQQMRVRERRQHGRRRASSAMPREVLRHASPVHIHVGRDADGGYVVSAVAFPSAYLPELRESEEVLREFLEQLEAELTRRAALDEPQKVEPEQKAAVAPPPKRPASPSRKPAPRRPTPKPKPPKAAKPKLAAGQFVKCVLLEEKTKKGGWKARVADKQELIGPIVNTGDVPSDKNPGDEVELKIVSIPTVPGAEAMFRWPTEEDLQPKDKKKRKKKKEEEDKG